MVGRLTSQGRANRVASKMPPLLCHHKFGESLERISPLQTEEFLDILSPVSVHPFLKVAFRVFLREKEGRKTAPQKTVL